MLGRVVPLEVVEVPIREALGREPRASVRPGLLLPRDDERDVL